MPGYPQRNMQEIVEALADRYSSRLDSSEASERLQGMLDALCESATDWPIDKTNRWIGFIQGVLWSKGLIDIDEERNFTRPLFHKYYKQTGVNIPESVDVSKE